MAKKPSAGRMHQRLHFQKREIVDDSYGNEVAGPFETVFTAAAELIPLRGGELCRRPGWLACSPTRFEFAVALLRVR
ncbi:phage head completion protein [Sinorhizobium meliloti]|uniref:phage head completion protein n=1 Tax=Rhizobium meliloti TaxID=382 RepID=UPI003D6536CB